MGTHPIFESDFDCLTESMPARKKAAATKARKSTHKKTTRSSPAVAEAPEPEIEQTPPVEEESSQSSLATDPGPSPSELEEENISFSNDEEEKTVPGLSEDEKEEENKEEEKDDELNEMLEKANEKKNEEEVAKNDLTEEETDPVAEKEKRNLRK